MDLVVRARRTVIDGRICPAAGMVALWPTWRASA
jgi:hypothetical protein